MKALSGFAIPATALLVLVGLIFLVVAVAFRWFEVNASWGKLVLKVQRPPKAVASPSQPAPSVVQGTAEEAPKAVIDQEIPGQAGTPIVAEPENDETGFMAYFRARTVDAIDKAFPAFIATLDGESDEFWQTDYRERRAGYGADNGRDGVRQLITDHPTWAYPHAVLLKWSIDDHDFAAAEEHLAAGLSRQSSPQLGYVLSAGVRLRFMTGGPRSGLRLCAEWSTASIPERIKAGAFVTLADLLKDVGDTEGQRIALEWAIAIFPQSEGNIFTLAYSYGDTAGRWASSMWHYQRIVGKADNGPVARNNLGVLLGHFDKKVQIDTYEGAAAEGDLYAVANIAHLLIAEGFVRAGERLLKSVAEPGAAAELHGTAATAAHAAQRQLDDRRAGIDGLVERETKPFRQSLAKALRHTQSGGMPAQGAYASKDALIVVLVKEGRALCRIRAGTTDFEGILKDQGTCYAGRVTSSGSELARKFLATGDATR